MYFIQRTGIPVELCLREEWKILGKGNNGKTDTIYPQKAACACFKWHMTNMVLFFFPQDTVLLKLTM